MGMRLEVLNFFNNNNLIQDLEEIKQEYQQLKQEPIVGYQIEYYNNIAGVQEKTDEIFLFLVGMTVHLGIREMSA